MRMAMLEVIDWLELRAPAFKRAHRAMALARSKVALIGCEVGEHVLVHGKLQIERRGTVSVGEQCVFVGGPFPTSLRVERGASLNVGAKCYFNYGVAVEVAESIRMGANCMFGSYVRISDARG